MNVNPQSTFEELHGPVTVHQTLTNRLATLATIWEEPLRSQMLEAAAAQATAILDELQSDDGATSAEAAGKVMQMGFPATPTWFGTPLGRLVFHAQYHRHQPAPADDAMTQSQAAEVLGISRQRVSILKQEGKLVAHPNGGVTRSSVAVRAWQETSTDEAVTRAPTGVLSALLETTEKFSRRNLGGD